MNLNKFKPLKPTEIGDNVFSMINDDWFLLSAGNPDSFNTMTASWGGMGILWNKPVVFVFVRPQRYTYKFMESEPLFTLSFFGEKYREALNLCGKVSGRNTDKMKATGLNPMESPAGSVFFEEARLLIECRKLYYSDIKPEQFQHAGIQNNYPKNDYHRMYIGEILSCFSDPGRL
jgi:flavin reductase (DIM6/NTAB) family NADH-FMN oxidoreductase RutF